MICKNCGYENNDTSVFCAECGAPLAREEMIAPAAVNEIPADVPAAPEAPVYAATAAPVYAPQAPQQPYAPAYPQAAAPAYPQAAAPACQAPQPTAPQPEKKKSGKGGRIALIVAVVVLALALLAGGFFGYRLYQQKTDEINALEAEKTAMQDQLEQAEEDQGALADDYNALSSKYDTLSDDYNALTEQYDELDKAYDELHDYATELYDEYSGMYDEYWFFKNHAVFASDMNKYYHAYNCEDWDRDGFWIYNLENAKAKEFTACPKCMAEADNNS